MLMTSTEIKKELKEMWPGLTLPIFKDTGDFWLMSLDEVVPYFENSPLRGLPAIGTFWDCDDFSLKFVSDIRWDRFLQWQRGELKGDRVNPTPIGIATGPVFRGIPSAHDVALARLVEGHYIFDLFPMADRYWKVQNNKDDQVVIYYV